MSNTRVSKDEYAQLLAERKFLKRLLAGDSGYAFIPREIENELSLVEKKLSQYETREEIK